MKLIISNHSPVPIFEQIKEMIVAQILSGELMEGEMLPSIRALARDTKISVMTIKKAYDELERDGYIVTRQGKGSFVAVKNMDLIREQKQKEMEEYMIEIIKIGNHLGISKKELMSLFDFIYESGEQE